MIIPLILISALMAAWSQILLKKASGIIRQSLIREYLNAYVIFGYAGYAGVLTLNIYLFTKMDFRFGVLSNALAIVFVMLLSGKILNEEITRKKWIGTILIAAGVICFLW